MKQDLIKYVNSNVLRDASSLRFEVRDLAPSSFSDLINEPGLKIWSGESRNTVFQDETVNWAFRALHDDLHLRTGLGFSPEHEIELGRLQALEYGRRCDQFLADLVYVEVAEQAKHYKATGCFVLDQVQFSLDALKRLGYCL